MEDFKQRLITEQEELDNKLNKLLSFLETKTFDGLPTNQKHLMFDQAEAMNTYNNVLKERIYLLTDHKKQAVQEFLKNCKFGFSQGSIYFSASMDKFTLFFNENGADFFDVWNEYSDSEKDKMLQECFIVR